MKKVLIFVLFISSFAIAQDDVIFEYDTPINYNFDIAVGYSQTSGNTHTKSLNLKTNFVKKNENRRIYFDGYVLYGESDGVKIAEEIDTKGRLERRKGRVFLFWDLRFFRNPFQNFEYRVATGPGIGYFFSHSDKLYLSGSYYLYYYYDKISNTISYVDRYFMHNIEERFKFSFNENLAFKQKMIYSLNNENFKDYYIDFELLLINTLTQHLALQISYLAKYQNIPKEDIIERLDTTFTTSILIQF
jgi:putative salt-induced outer membrane protein YdiY